MPAILSLGNNAMLIATDDQKLALRREEPGKEIQEVIIGPLTDETIEHLIYGAQQMKIFA